MQRSTKRRIMATGTLVAIGLLSLVVQFVAAQQELQDEPLVPSNVEDVLSPSRTLFSYQGQLSHQDGSPVDGTVDMTFSFYHEAEGGTAFWTETYSGTNAIAVSQGMFRVPLGSLVAIDPVDLIGDVYLEVGVDGETLMPRELLTSVAYAVVAETLPDQAETRGGLTVSGDLAIGGGTVYLNGGTLESAGNIHGHGSQQIHMPSNNGNIYVNWGRGESVVFGGGDAAADVIIHGAGIDLLGRTLYNAGNIDGHGSQQIHMPSTNGNIYMNWGKGESVVFGGGDAAADVVIHGSGIDLQGNSVFNCGALTEANLQTEEELAAERINRFEEGDLLCWGVDQLELCSTANDRLVQAVADPEGRPIVLGAEAVKVLGPVRRGDILVASGVPGYAMVNNDPISGSVIAQALEDYDGEMGIIKAMIRKF